MKKIKEDKDNRSPGRAVMKGISFAAVTLVGIILILLCVVFVLERGPSPTLTGLFCRSVRETSAIRWVSTLFLSEEELKNYLTEPSAVEVSETVNTSLIRVSENEQSDSVELVDISYGNCKGKMLLVSDPKRVILGTSEPFEDQPGLALTEMVEKYDGIAGINAGGFKDDGGRGNGGTPTGLVLTENGIAYGNAYDLYHVVGLDGQGILHVGTMSGEDALRQGIINGVSFVTHDGLASSLIINGVVQEQNLGAGVNPRTAIGQRPDGTILLLVLDGRSIDTLGATLEDVCNIMIQYGAVNAGNLDGGSSSLMVYDGEIVNHCSSLTGPREVPTGFVVLKKPASNSDR